MEYLFTLVAFFLGILIGYGFWLRARSRSVTDPEAFLAIAQNYFDRVNLTVPRLLGMVRELQDAQQLKQNAQLWQEYLLLAIEGLECGVVDWDLRNDSIYWSENADRLYGLDQGTAVCGYETLMKPIHPDYRTLVGEVIQNAIEHKTEFQLDEYCIITPDGEERWLTSAGRVLVDAQGRAARLIEVIQDRTEYKRLQQAHFKQEIKWRALVSSSSDVVATLDQSGRIAYISPTIEKLLGYQVNEVSGGDFLELVHLDDRPRFSQAFAQSKGTLANVLTITCRCIYNQQESIEIMVEASLQNAIEATGGIILTIRKALPVQKPCHDKLYGQAKAC